MIYLVASIISSVLIAVVIRINEERGLDRLGVMFFNYLASSIFSLVAVDRSTLTSHLAPLAPLALASGFIYVTAFLVYMKAVGRFGLAIPVTITRLSVVIPALGSVIVFGERVNTYQGTGLLLALVAIVLFSRANSKGGGEKKGADLFLMPLLFFMMGCGDFTLKIFEESYPGGWLMGFVLAVFGIAGVYTLIIIVIKGIKIDLGIAAGGILLGIPNFTGAYFFLKVLQVYPGPSAFPLNSIGIILLSTMVGVLFWNERFRRRTWTAIGMSLAAAALLNL